MRTLIGASRNLMIGLDEEGKPKAVVEAVLLASETEYSLADDGSLVKSTRVTDHRFVAPIESLRLVADSFSQWANEAEDVCERTTFRAESDTEAASVPEEPEVDNR